MNVIFVIFCLIRFSVINGDTVYRFGPADKFMCHCKIVNEECNKQTGNCPNGCASPWFGPGCQYRDLVHLQGSNVSQKDTNGYDAQKTVDGDVNSCSGTNKLSNPWWKVWLPQNETITELYIISKYHQLKHFINTSVFIEYVSERHTQDKTQKSQLCYKGNNFIQDKASFVIRCDKPSAGNQVRIQLEGKRKLVLCDVRINGGRNLALGRKTRQISTIRDSGHAVDGDMATCSRTDVSNKPAWWTVSLKFTAIIQHITVTTSTEYRTGVKGRLFDAKNKLTHNWEDDGNSQHVTYAEGNRLEIRPNSGNIIIICETELYGDCAENLCGLDCKSECHCKSMTIWTRISANCSTTEIEVDEERYSTSAKDLGQESVCDDGSYGKPCIECGYCLQNKSCYKTNGTCPSGCQSGYTGDLCNMKCDSGKYGDQCGRTCSKTCRGSYGCNNVNGSCVLGCKTGWQGEKCEDECKHGKWGVGCKHLCGNCSDGTCNPVDGQCRGNCSIGFKFTPMCNQECSKNKYGQGCAKTCNTNCKHGTCNHMSGKCDDGCKDGWQGDKCDECTAGNICRRECSDHCIDGKCNHINGTCESGCKAGWQGESCKSECDDGFYGSNCSETCGSCNNGADCDKVTGVCPNGCSSGYSVVAKQASAGMSIPLGIGAGVFLLLGLGLIVLFVKLRRRKRRVPTGDDIELHYENVNNDSKAGPSGTHAQSPLNTDKVEDGRSKSRVQVSELLQYVKQTLSSKEQLISEFQTIPYGLHYASKSASLPVNIAKNRYKEIYPYDHSRVMLSTIQGQPNSVYINASYVQGRFRENAYIAAQGPTKESLDDFWRMIWEKDVRTIAMLTKLVEERKVKCIQYWGPQNSETIYGNLTVCNVSENIFAEYTIRRFKVFYKTDREHDRTITQFHYTAWPDKGVPRSTSSLVQFWHVVRQTNSLKFNTWLVHCSAGVGRTGTFIAMDLLYDEGIDLGTVDIHHCVQTLREQRMNMVQTKEQYKFLHGLAVEMLVLPSKRINIDAYSALYTNLKTVDSQSGKSALLQQYEGLQDELSFMDLVYESCKLPKADDNDDRFAAAKLDANKSKNRYQNVIPANEFRPFLSSNVPGCNNYINAVYLQSCCNLRGYILTQTPMKETAIDCCRLVIEEEVKVIVTFSLKGKGKEDVGEYLPESGTIELGPFTCTKLSETDESNYVLRKHKIVYKTESHETIVYQLIFKNWPTKSVIPSDSHSILNFLQAVEIYNRREAGKAIVVQCLERHFTKKCSCKAFVYNILSTYGAVQVLSRYFAELCGEQHNLCQHVID